ncbi:MAG: chitobiase/beta-hexosaminidase C-terminal domain-containing protein, partial [Verrucomicrobiota bacterium]
MKTTLLGLAGALAVISSFAQGTIVVGNGITATRFPIYGPQLADPSIQVVGNGPLSAPTGSTVFTGALLSGTRYVIEFWAGPASATDFSGLSLIRTTTFRTAAISTSLPNGLTTTLTGMIPNVPADAQAKLAVRVWDSLSGASYETAGVRAQGALFLSGPLGGGLTTSPNWVGQSFSLVGPPPPPSAPSITTPPTSAAIVVGQAASFSVTAAGTGPLRYQWRKAGSPIGDATNSVLSFASAALGDAGNYDVVVTNFYGSAISAGAVLQVTLSNAPNVQVNGQLAVDSIAVGSPANITISGGFPGGFIFYTLDGSPPTISATLYSGGFSLTNSQTIRALSLSADFS